MFGKASAKIVLIIFFLPFFLSAQKKGFLEFSGRCLQQFKPIKDARVSVYSGPTKVAEIKTSKSGQFMFDLDFGQDYKVVFSKSGSPEMYLLIQASKCPVDKKIFPSYEIDVSFFDFRDVEINDQAFRSPITKVVFDQKGIFKDDEEYLTAFFDNIFLSPSETKKNEELKILRESQELMALVKQEEERLASTNFNNVERLTDGSYFSFGNKPNPFKANSPSPVKKQNLQNKIKNQIELALYKEEKTNLGQANKSIKIEQEKEWIQAVYNSSQNQEDKKAREEKNKIIIALEQQAILKAKADELRRGLKHKSKIRTMNQSILNSEITSLLSSLGFKIKEQTKKSNGEVAHKESLDIKTMVGISTDKTEESTRTTWLITINSNGKEDLYKKEKYNFGLVYYFKNNRSISEKLYHESLAQYHIPR